MWRDFERFSQILYHLLFYTKLVEVIEGLSSTSRFHENANTIYETEFVIRWWSTLSRDSRQPAEGTQNRGFPGILLILGLCVASRCITTDVSGGRLRWLYHLFIGSDSFFGAPLQILGAFRSFFRGMIRGLDRDRDRSQHSIYSSSPLVWL